MSTERPNELLDKWTETFNAGDMEGLLALYEEDAVFFPERGNRCQGTDQIKASLESWFALSPNLQMEGIHLVECGDLALSKSRWSLSATAADGEPIELEGMGTEVFRKQADGRWQFAIDDPFGPQ